MLRFRYLPLLPKAANPDSAGDNKKREEDVEEPDEIDCGSSGVFYTSRSPDIMRLIAACPFSIRTVWPIRFPASIHLLSPPATSFPLSRPKWRSLTAIDMYYNISIQEVYFISLIYILLYKSFGCTEYLYLGRGFIDDW